jgi:hypothetical protein
VTRPATDLERNLKAAASMRPSIVATYATLQSAAYAPIRRSNGTGGSGGIAKPTEQALCTCSDTGVKACVPHRVRSGLEDVDRICAAIELEARRAVEILARMSNLMDPEDRPEPGEQQRRERERIPKAEHQALKDKAEQRHTHVEQWGDESFSNARKVQ